MEAAKRVCGVLLLCASCAMIGCQGSAKPKEIPFPVERIELRPVESEAGDGLEEAESRDAEGKVYLHPPDKGLKGEKDIARAVIVIHPEESWVPMLFMEFTESGQKKMERINKEHLGKRVAAMIDGEVRSTAQIKAASKAEIAIAAVFTREEARREGKAAGPK
jgi:preprotein translocase subunit SecD